MKPTIYVVSKGAHDYAMAEEYGELKYMFEDKVNVFAADQLVKDIQERVTDSSPADYLIMSGNMMAAAMTFYEMMTRHGAVNVLIWSFKHEKYEVRTVRRGQFTPAAMEA